MIVQFAEGHERGHCEKCGRDYDTRRDCCAGWGMCGRCWRWRFAWVDVPAAVCTFGEMGSRNLVKAMTVAP